MVAGRDLSFDYIKGILIFLVVLGHVVTYIPFPHISDNYLFIFIYSFHMPLFIFISGYFFDHEKRIEMKLLVPKKIRRLLLPHFSFSIVLVSIVILFYPIFNSVIYDGNHISHYKIYHVVLTSLWFLWCVFFCSVVVGFIFNYISKPWLICFLLCISLLCVYNYLPNKIFKDLQLVIQLPFFLLGMFYKEYQVRINKYARTVLTVAGLGYLFLYWGYANENPYYKITWFVFSVPLFFIIIKQMYKYKCAISIFCVLGNISIGIYIFHLLLMILSKNSLLGNLWINTGSHGWNYLICLLISATVCYFSYYLIILIRKNKYAKFLFLGETLK